MRRFALALVFFLLVGVGLVLTFREHNGYMLMAWRGWEVETSLLFFLLFLVVVIWFGLTVWRLLTGGLQLPSRVGNWWRARRARKARNALKRGVIKMSEGRWEEAEEDLVRRARDHDSPIINYLTAARVAQRRGAYAQRDRYLQEAVATNPDAELAVLLTQAELQIDQRQNEEALATLSRLQEIEPRHPYVLELLVNLLESLQDWPQLRQVLPQVERGDIIRPARREALEDRAWSDYLAQSKQAGALEAVTDAWDEIPRRIKRRTPLLRAYVSALEHVGGNAEALRLIQDAMKKQWDAELALHYGEIEAVDQTAQLAVVEAWLKQYGPKPELLLVAGRLCLRNRLWGRARSYLERSLEHETRADALWELGRLCEQTEEDAAALEAYRHGLGHVLSRDGAKRSLQGQGAESTTAQKQKDDSA